MAAAGRAAEAEQHLNGELPPEHDDKEGAEGGAAGLGADDGARKKRKKKKKGRAGPAGTGGAEPSPGRRPRTGQGPGGPGGAGPGGAPGLCPQAGGSPWSGVWEPPARFISPRQAGAGAGAAPAGVGCWQGTVRSVGVVGVRCPSCTGLRNSPCRALRAYTLGLL